MIIDFNARALLKPICGVRRYSEGLLTGLRELGLDVRVHVPPRSVERSRAGHIWEQLVLPLTCRGVLISPANSGPFFTRNQIVVVHDLGVLDAPQCFKPSYVQLHRGMLKRLVGAGSGFAFPSDFSRERFIAHFPGLDSACKTVGLCPTDLLLKPKGALPTAVDAAVAAGKKVALVTGAGDARKRFDLVLQAYRESAELQDRYVLVALGSRQRVVSRGALNEGEGVVLLEGCSDSELRALYSNADVYIAASDYEGYDIPPVEALLHGCPVVCSDIPVHREVLGQFGPTFFESGSVEGLIAALTSIRNSTPGNNDIRTRLPTWTQVATRLVDFIRDRESQ